MRINEAFTAGQIKPYTMRGNFLRLESANLVDVDFYRGGQLLPENLRSASSGYWAQPEGGFDEARVTSPSIQTVVLDIYRGRVGADRVAGAVSVSAGPSGAHAASSVVVSNANVLILAANPNRKYLLIQNRDPAESLYLRTDGGAAAVSAACMELPPGAVYEPALVPTGDIRGIRGAVVAGASVHIIEG